MPHAWQVKLDLSPFKDFLIWNIYFISPTDLCSSLEVDEVEIFSLIEEQIPKYKIRADQITTFAGTTNQDFEFVQFPALKIPDNINLGLTSDQIRETLNYFREYSIHSSSNFNSWMRVTTSRENIVTGHNIDSWPPHFTYALINERKEEKRKERREENQFSLTRRLPRNVNWFRCVCVEQVASRTQTNGGG